MSFVSYSHLILLISGQTFEITVAAGYATAIPSGTVRPRFHQIYREQRTDATPRQAHLGETVCCPARPFESCRRREEGASTAGSRCRTLRSSAAQPRGPPSARDRGRSREGGARSRRLSSRRASAAPPPGVIPCARGRGRRRRIRPPSLALEARRGAERAAATAAMDEALSQHARLWSRCTMAASTTVVPWPSWGELDPMVGVHKRESGVG